VCNSRHSFHRLIDVGGGQLTRLTIHITVSQDESTFIRSVIFLVCFIRFFFWLLRRQVDDDILNLIRFFNEHIVEGFELVMHKLSPPILTITQIHYIVMGFFCLKL
jgi:hypothetical protein